MGGSATRRAGHERRACVKFWAQPSAACFLLRAARGY